MPGEGGGDKLWYEDPTRPQTDRYSPSSGAAGHNNCTFRDKCIAFNSHNDRRIASLTKKSGYRITRNLHHDRRGSHFQNGRQTSMVFHIDDVYGRHTTGDTQSDYVIHVPTDDVIYGRHTTGDTQSVWLRDPRAVGILEIFICSSINIFQIWLCWVVSTN